MNEIMNERQQIMIIKQKVSQFYMNGSNHQELVELINDPNSLKLCYEFYTDENQCIKHFGITGLINKIKKQMMNDEEFHWLHREIDMHFYTEKINLLYFIKMFAYLKLLYITKSDDKSLLALIKNFNNNDEQCLNRNMTLISSMLEIVSARDLPLPMMSNVNATLFKEAKNIICYILEIIKCTDNQSLQLITLKSLSHLYNYCGSGTAASIQSLQQYVMECILKPDLFSDAVDLLTNILVSSNLNDDQLECVIRHTLMSNSVVETVIRDQKAAVANEVEWKDRDKSEKQMAYALCEYIGSLINLTFDSLVAFFTMSSDLSSSRREAMEYLLKLVLQLLSIDGDIPKFNDIFIAIVNNVHILLEELSEMCEDGESTVILSFQKNLVDIFFHKLKHPYSYGCTDADMDEFLDNRDNVSYSFESMNSQLLTNWLKEKFYIFSQQQTLNIGDIETVLFFYSQIPNLIPVVPFQILHTIFQRAFVSCNPEFQETLIDTYIVLLKELFQYLDPEELDAMIAFVWDILRNYQPAVFSAAALLSNIYQSSRLELTSISAPRETQTLMLIKSMTTDNIQQNSFRDFIVTLYSVVGRLTCLCQNNEELNSISSVFISPIFDRISQSVQELVANANSNGSTISNSTISASAGNANAADSSVMDAAGTGGSLNNSDQDKEHPQEACLANQITIIAKFLGPFSRFPNAGCQFIYELLTALLQLLSQLSEVVIFSVEFYSALQKLCHSALLTESVSMHPDLAKEFVSQIMNHTQTAYYKLPLAGRCRPACLDLTISCLNTTFQLLLTIPFGNSTRGGGGGGGGGSGDGLTSSNINNNNNNNNNHVINSNNQSHQHHPQPVSLTNGSGGGGGGNKTDCTLFNNIGGRFAAQLFTFFCNLLLDYTFNRFRKNFYMPMFIARCLKFVHSALTEHGLPSKLRNSISHQHIDSTSATTTDSSISDTGGLILEHSPSTTRTMLSPGKLSWLNEQTLLLREINWCNIFFIPAFYLGDLTPDVNRASIRLLISAVKCRAQLPDFIGQALVTNLQLVIFNVVKLFSFGVMELGDMVSLITALREHLITESVKMLQLVDGEPIVQNNNYLQSVTKLVLHLLTSPKLSGSTMRTYITNFQDNFRYMQPPIQPHYISESYTNP